MGVRTEVKDDKIVPLKPNVYTKVGSQYFEIDGTNRGGHAKIYLNIEGKIKSHPVGSLRVKAVRRRNGDSTSYQSYTVCRKPDGTFEHLITLTWFGNVVANEWYDYYVKIQDYIVSANANVTGADHVTTMPN